MMDAGADPPASKSYASSVKSSNDTGGMDPSEKRPPDKWRGKRSCFPDQALRRPEGDRKDFWEDFFFGFLFWTRLPSAPPGAVLGLWPFTPDAPDDARLLLLLKRFFRYFFSRSA